MPARIALIALLSLGYLLGSHWLMTSAPPSPWNAVALLSPMLVATAFGCWQAGQRWRSGIAMLLVAGLVLQATLGVHVPAPVLYLSEHVVINTMLGLWFASTLREGQQPLITRLAARVHGSLTPEMASYTRNVTRSWVAYFVLVVLLSVVVFVLAPFQAWAVFSNLLTPVALVLMFVGERLVRFRLHPDFKRSSMSDAIRAYMQDAAGAPAPRHDPSA